MDRTAIRNFAIFARNKLIEDIKERKKKLQDIIL